jgi:hypothetical protein
MDLEDVALAWQTDGFVILPGFLPADELTSAVGELDLLFPSAEGFHDGTDPRRERFIGDEFAGIDTFPFASTEISLLAVNHRILELAEALLDDGDIHIYAAEAWAKYTGACDYDQDMHRDYLNHTVLVPSTTPGCRQVEMFVFLNDVPRTSARRIWSPANTPPTFLPCPTGSCGRVRKAPDHRPSDHLNRDSIADLIRPTRRNPHPRGIASFKGAARATSATPAHRLPDPQPPAQRPSPPRTPKTRSSAVNRRVPRRVEDALTGLSTRPIRLVTVA